MSERLSWSIKCDQEITVVTFQGPIDEDANFSQLIQELSDKANVRFDLSGLARINSCGVREWVNFIRALPSGSSLSLEKCTPAVVSQLNMISNFAGNAKVMSVKAPFVCNNCGSEEDILIEVQANHIPELKAMACKKCSGSMEFDDVEDSYFAFLN